MKDIFKTFLPTFIAYLNFALVSIVDGMYVGKLYGMEGQVAMGLASPLVVFMSAFVFSFIVGGNTYFGHAIGQEDEEEANKIFNHNIIYGTLSLVFLIILMYIIVVPFINGKILNENISYYFVSYIVIILPSYVVLFLASFLNFIRRVIGDVNVVAKLSLIALVINIIFNAIFTLIIPMGIMGIAFASLLSLSIQLIYLIYIYKRESSPMFKLKFYKLDIRLMLKIFINGLSDGIFDLSNGIVQILNITLLSVFVGIYAPSYIYVLNSILILQFMMFFSLSDSINPLVSIQFGNKNFEKIKSYRNNALILSFVIGIGAYVAIFFLKSTILSLFSIDAVEVRNYLMYYSNYYFLVVLVFGLNQTLIAYTTAIGWSKLSLFLGMMRNIVFIVFITILFTELFGEVGLWISYFSSEVFSLIFILVLLFVIKPLKQEEKKVSIEEKASFEGIH